MAAVCDMNRVPKPSVQHVLTSVLELFFRRHGHEISQNEAASFLSYLQSVGDPKLCRILLNLENSWVPDGYCVDVLLLSGKLRRWTQFNLLLSSADGKVAVESIFGRQLDAQTASYKQQLSQTLGLMFELICSILWPDEF